MELQERIAARLRDELAAAVAGGFGVHADQGLAAVEAGGLGQPEIVLSVEDVARIAAAEARAWF